MQSSNSRLFFDSFLKPNYDEWLNDHCDLRRAMNATLSANHMADWYFKDLKCLKKLPLSISNVREFRDDLVTNICADFKIIRDVADAHKHFELSRPSRNVTTAKQTTAGSLGWGEGGWGEGGWGEGVWGGGPQLIIKLDNGQKRAFSAPMMNVFKMWEDLLPRHGL